MFLTWPEGTKKYTTDDELDRFQSDNVIPPEAAEAMLCEVRRYREALRELTLIRHEHLFAQKWVDIESVQMHAWCALKWIDGLARGLTVPPQRRSWVSEIMPLTRKEVS